VAGRNGRAQVPIRHDSASHRVQYGDVDAAVVEQVLGH
jgi:hypothetical protein